MILSEFFYIRTTFYESEENLKSNIVILKKILKVLTYLFEIFIKLCWK